MMIEDPPVDRQGRRFISKCIVLLLLATFVSCILLIQSERTHDSVRRLLRTEAVDNLRGANGLPISQDPVPNFDPLWKTKSLIAAHSNAVITLVSGDQIPAQRDYNAKKAELGVEALGEEEFQRLLSQRPESTDDLVDIHVNGLIKRQQFGQARETLQTYEGRFKKPLMQKLESASAQGELKVLYIIRTYPKNFHKLAEQAKSWLQEVEPENILVTSSKESQPEAPAGLREFSILRGDCQPGHAAGPACTEAKALMYALEHKNFDWVFIVDDDVLVLPDRVQHALEERRSDPMKSWGTLGCESNGILGYCGGGGYAISKAALQAMISKHGAWFYDRYMNLNSFTEFCDITTAHMLLTAKVEPQELPGLNPWVVPIDKDPEQNRGILSMHYLQGPMRDYLEQIHV